jgi:hypothetical protein
LKLVQLLARLALPLARLPAPLLVLVQVPPALLPVPLLLAPLVQPLVPLLPLLLARASLPLPLSLACPSARWLLPARRLRLLPSLQATIIRRPRTTDRIVTRRQALANKQAALGSGLFAFRLPRQ